MESFSFLPLKNLVGEGKWLLAMTSLEATNSFLNITDENNKFSISKPGHSNTKDG